MNPSRSELASAVSTVRCAHIGVDDRGIARIEGMRFKVMDLVIEHTVWKWPAEAIKLQHPELSLAQIHSALAYYYDNQAEVDAQIQDRDRRVEELRREFEDPARQAELRKRLAERAAAS